MDQKQLVQQIVRKAMQMPLYISNKNYMKKAITKTCTYYAQKYYDQFLSQKSYTIEQVSGSELAIEEMARVLGFSQDFRLTQLVFQIIIEYHCNKNHLKILKQSNKYRDLRITRSIKGNKQSIKKQIEKQNILSHDSQTKGYTQESSNTLLNFLSEVTSTDQQKYLNILTDKQILQIINGKQINKNKSQISTKYSKDQFEKKMKKCICLSFDPQKRYQPYILKNYQHLQTQNFYYFTPKTFKKEQKQETLIVAIISQNRICISQTDTKMLKLALKSNKRKKPNIKYFNKKFGDLYCCHLVQIKVQPLNKIQNSLMQIFIKTLDHIGDVICKNTKKLATIEDIKQQIQPQNITAIGHQNLGSLIESVDAIIQKALNSQPQSLI